MKYDPMQTDRKNDGGANAEFVHKSASLEKILLGLSASGKVSLKKIEMTKKVKVKLSLYQAMEAHRVVRR
jgi:hypothetical protein